MDLKLTDRVVVVTGASRGLGAAIAAGLAAEGALVVAAARSLDQVEALAAAHPGRVHAHRLDVRDEQSLAALVPAVVGRFGRIDGLVNNAGIAPAGKFATQDPHVWADVMAVNALAPMLLAQAAGQQMIAQGGGQILNIASTTGVRGKPLLVGYSSSKAAVVRMTEALAGEWARYDVQVNCLAPGAFATDAQRAVTESPTLLAKRVAKIPARRMADPSEVVPMACLLVSPLSAFTTGAVVVVDGGESSTL